MIEVDNVDCVSQTEIYLVTKDFGDHKRTCPRGRDLKKKHLTNEFTAGECLQNLSYRDRPPMVDFEQGVAQYADDEP